MSRLVLGGGIAGLSAAYFLLRNGVCHPTQLKIIEASKRVGGHIQTLKQPNGIRFELGPRTVRPYGDSGKHLLQFIESLALDKQVLVVPADHPASKNRLILVDGKLIKIPSSLKDLLKIIPPFKQPLILSVSKDLFTLKKTCEDESMHSFFSRRFGDDIANYIIDPLCRGICAGDSKQISMKLFLKPVFEAEQQHGSVVLGLLSRSRKDNNALKKTQEVRKGILLAAQIENWRVWSLEGGLQVLPDTLKDVLLKEGVDIVLNTPCHKLQISPKGIKVYYGDNVIEAAQLVCAMPAFKLAPLLQQEHPELAKGLASIPYVSVAVVNMQYSGQVLKEAAFGFLVPSSQSSPLLGMIYDTCVLPQGDSTVLTAMLGGHSFAKHLGDNPSQSYILDLVTKELQEVLGIRSIPDQHNVTILNNCLPQYLVGHEDKVKRMRSYIKQKQLPLLLVGSSYDGISVNDAIYSSKMQINNPNKSLI